MHVYVIAASDFGPSKIGVSINPEKRLRTLQTSSPHRLSFHHLERVGNARAALAVERAALRALLSLRSDAGNEWHELPPREAAIAVRSAASAAAILSDGSASLSELSRAAALCWLKEVEDLRATYDDEGEGSITLDDIRSPDVLELMAGACRPPAVRFSFNDYLLMFDEGAWHRAAREQLGERLPSGRNFGPYLRADDYLEERGVKEGRRVAERRIEWCHGRDLTSAEVSELTAVWNAYAPLYNLLENTDPYIPAHGIDDRIDDVDVYVLIGDESRGDRQRVIFHHADFLAVLAPQRAQHLYSLEARGLSRLYPIGRVPVAGFVAPIIRGDIWERPLLLSWLRQALTDRDRSLARFLGNPTKRYPELNGRRPIEYGQALAAVKCELPIVDLTGTW
jgi:hypothetical protein